ncbi:hypothetical protein CMQ_4729 [Grosmannia clavigera kw1407]|uniref:Uncharacterized protein n=1 Tax=Grosmannia clavigera (strain kw1407 / UAMH 11150) TaxID=655863 RepID=F0XU47_GROCL|nr:uncharacterized protein CMQ_4729 [Grosmannia clavigera kw1407]EFW98877.1 hypothetical protein CMQ_4729 [Grosmannia clavigera kw1407]
MSLPIPPQPLVWINGWPEAGKRTLAQCLVHLLGQDRAVLAGENEYATEYAASGQSNKSVGRKSSKPDLGSESDPVSEKQAAYFRKYVEDPQALKRIVVFTDFQADSVKGRSRARAFEEAARRTGRPFVPVYMECDLEANVRRSQASERRHSRPAVKMLSETELRELRKPGVQLYKFSFDEHPGVCVDVTSRETHNTAMRIMVSVREAAENRQHAAARAVGG